MLQAKTTAKTDREKADEVQAALREVLPAREFRAVDLWLGTLFPYQREWALCWDRFAICNKARQIGTSHATAAATVLWAMMGEQTSIISIGQDEGDEFLLKCRMHAEMLCELGSVWARATPTASKLSFTNTSGRILARPSTSAGRSLSGNVVLDEFAYHGTNDGRVWDGAAAVTLHNGRLRIISTPNGTGNLFHEVWTNPKSNKGYRKFEFPIKRAIADGMSLNMDQLWSMAHGDPRVFAQIFECSFLDGAEQYLATSDITAAIDDDACGQCQGDIYAGLDVGLVNDLSSLVIVRQDAYTGRCHIVDREDWKRTDWTAQQEGIEAAHRRWNFRRLCVDATGLGSVPAELLQKKLGRQRVEPVTFSSQTKEELATTLYQAFADRMVVMRRDRDLVDDLCAIRRIVTTGGAVRYDAERSERGHADRAWALALALYACSSKPARRNERGSAVA